MYCTPIGRGAQIISPYIDALSRGYMKILSKKQKKRILNGLNENYQTELRKGLENIADQYARFLQKIQEFSEQFNLDSTDNFDDQLHELLEKWLIEQIKTMQKALVKDLKEDFSELDNHTLKKTYDKILAMGTCSCLLGKIPSIVNKSINPFSLFSAYHQFKEAHLCNEITKAYIDKIINEFDVNCQNNSARLDSSTNKLLNVSHYSVKDFIDDLLEALNQFPEEMYALNPSCIKRAHSGYTLKDLSNLWGHWNGYISDMLQYYKNRKEYIVPDNKLAKLEINIMKKYGNKGNLCLSIIESHKKGDLSFELLIVNLREELGKISNKVQTTLEDLAIIFDYGYGMMSYIHQHADFLLTREKLNTIRNNLRLILGRKAKEIITICDKYERLNPHLLDYPNQNYTIQKPNFFREINKNPESLYWFGWLCSDGWISQPGNTHYQIQLSLKSGDRIILERFADVLGYDHQRISDEVYLFKNKEGEIKRIERSRIIFGVQNYVV